MLNWLRRLLAIPAAPEPVPARTLTHEQLELRLDEFSKDVEWTLNEWYEKFNTLHARLAKRTKRAQAEVPIVNGHDADPPPQRKSILHVRRSPWSI